MDFEQFDFWTDYSVDLEPEAPARGEWGCPTFTFDGQGGAAREGLDHIGLSLLAQFSTDSSSWVGRFPCPSGSARRVLATPNPSTCVVVSGVNAYLVDVSAPWRGAVEVERDVQSVAATLDPPLLVLASWTHLTGIGTSGVCWRSTRLAIDDLAILGVSDRGIECECDSPGVGGVRRLTVDPTNGAQIDGPRLPPEFAP